MAIERRDRFPRASQAPTLAPISRPLARCSRTPVLPTASNPSLPALAIFALLLAACSKDAKSPRRNPSVAPASKKASAGGAKATPSKAKPSQPALKLSQLSFAGPTGHREPAVFARGERLMALVSIRGFRHFLGAVKLTAHVDLRSSAGVPMMHQEMTLMRGKPLMPRPGYLRLGAKIALDPALPPGSYQLTLTVFDKRSGGKASIAGEMEVAGERLPRAEKLSLLKLHRATEGPLPAGAVMPIAFVAAGVQSKMKKALPRAAPRRHTQLRLHARIFDKRGKQAFEHRRPLPTRSRLFRATSIPAHFGLALPPTLRPGPYTLHLTLKDENAGAQSKAKLAFRVAPPRFAVINLHLHDAAHLPRRRFRLGERVFLRCSTMGFSSTKQGEAKLAIDFAISGPGGIYLAKKNAFTLEGKKSRVWVQAGRYARQLPLVLPNLAPLGRYQVLVRARDLLGKSEATGQFHLELLGPEIKPLASFRVDKLEARLRPDLPALPGDTFVSGQTYHLVVRAGGGKLKQVARATYHMQVEGSLRLKSTRGEVLRSWKRFFVLDRQLNYQPLRVLLEGKWTVPTDLPRGLYDLDISLLEKNTQRVSNLRRRIELVPARQ